MKTVKDYLDLGLVFVGDDMIQAVTGEPSYGSVSLAKCLFKCGEYPSGIKLVGSMCGMGEWIPSSFAWRNNDGVKPEYRGDKEIELKNGKVKLTSSLNSDDNEDWSILCASSDIVKWRPVILQSDDAKKEMQEKFLSALYADSAASKNVWNAIREQFCLPVGIDSPELREAFKSLNEYLERKPPFWNKSIQTLNCPCVAVDIDVPAKKFTIKEEAPKTTMTVNIEGCDYLLVSHAPTVSPKEDKPMKPVYTAEMHAKGDLPQVGAECLLKSGSLTQWFNGVCVGYDEDFAVFKMCDDYPFGARYAGFCIDRIKPIIKTIKVNGFDVPAPMSESPKNGSFYFLPDALKDDLSCRFTWSSGNSDFSWLSKGIVHSTESAAIAHAKAMLGIDPNA